MAILNRGGEPDAAELSQLTGHYTIDQAHSRIGFSVRHAVVSSVRGEFTEYDGRLYLDGSQPANSTAEVVIEVASIDTKQAQRDQHLRNGDFFAADTYPRITFRSTGAEPAGGGSYRLPGELTVKDTTRPVTLDLAFLGTTTDADGVRRVGFEGGTTIDRSDWGLTYNAALETGGVLIAEKVKITLNVSARKTG
ncbi:YceI family protein [Streptomyces sp. NPDC059477]|uniref:YceI family protein n=1 Tax=Streptomyces sp. NPDC059477 TaxID=3346847 RepID=UPI0036A885A5